MCDSLTAQSGSGAASWLLTLRSCAAPAAAACRSRCRAARRGSRSARRLRRAQPLAHPVLQLGLVGLLASASTTAAATLLAPLGVGHADHRRLGDGGMGDQHVLDLAGREVLGAAHDDVVEAAVEEEEAVLVERSRRRWSGTSRRRSARCDRGTRPRPARRGRRSRPARPVPAAACRRRRGSPARPTAAAGRPSRAGAHAGRRWRSRPRWSSGVEHRDRRAGLGEPVGVDEVDVGQRRHRPLDELDRHPAAAVGEVAQRRQRRALRPRPRRGCGRASSARPSPG